MDTNFGNLTASIDSVISVSRTASYVDSNNAYYAGTSQSFWSASISSSTIGTATVSTLNVTNLTAAGTVLLNGGLTIGAGTITGNVTGSVFGTASWATQASTASYVVTAQTASYIDKVNNQNYDNGTTVVPGDFKFIAGKTAMTSGAATSSIFTVLIGKVIGTNVWINASYPTTFLTTPGQSLLQVNVSSSGQVLISGAPSDTGTIIFTGIYV
jgi:hypothetical protein